MSSSTRNNYVFHFKIMFGTYCGNEMVSMGYLIQGLYYVDNISNNNMPQTFVIKVNALFKEIASNSKNLFHLRFCHIVEDRITKLKRMGILSDFQSASNSTCEAYLQGKMTRSPFVGQMAKAKDLLEIIHSIVCGPFSEMAKGGFFYLLPL